ncbi:hypothetical protein EV702DRAFT_1197447 [Suillus placidus]|uniref:Uncharacterized protein n=1 Tax=Suillus placidus TaxID=48579 RepID=A0A9P6ZUL9_9AGAM|nr:hypothetical protein EV702DRAFT_1197447 [Suillus placidus]
MLCFLLDIVELAESHTGVALARAFQAMLEHFGLTDQMLSLNADNAANNNTQGQAAYEGNDCPPLILDDDDDGDDDNSENEKTSSSNSDADLENDPDDGIDELQQLPDDEQQAMIVKTVAIKEAGDTSRCTVEFASDAETAPKTTVKKSSRAKNVDAVWASRPPAYHDEQVNKKVLLMNAAVSKRKAERSGRNFSVPITKGEQRNKDLPRPGNEKPKIPRTFISADWLAAHADMDIVSRIAAWKEGDLDTTDIENGGLQATLGNDTAYDREGEEGMEDQGPISGTNDADLDATSISTSVPSWGTVSGDDDIYTIAECSSKAGGSLNKSSSSSAYPSGSIFTAFARKDEEPVNYSHCSHTNPQVRARLVQWLTESNRFLNIINDRALRDLLTAGRPSIQLPSCFTISRDNAITGSFILLFPKAWSLTVTPARPSSPHTGSTTKAKARSSRIPLHLKSCTLSGAIQKNNSAYTRKLSHKDSTISLNDRKLSCKDSTISLNYTMLSRKNSSLSLNELARHSPLKDRHCLLSPDPSYMLSHIARQGWISPFKALTIHAGVCEPDMNMNIQPNQIQNLSAWPFLVDRPQFFSTLSHSRSDSRTGLRAPKSPSNLAFLASSPRLPHDKDFEIIDHTKPRKIRRQ